MSTAEAGAQKIDTAFVAPGAIAVLLLRPAQLMASPLAELLPTEVATAAGLHYLGIDPRDVDEVIAFVGMPGPAGLEYGVTIKFNKPFRGSSIPPQLRPMVQLSELAGRKYLQSGQPMWPSYYGTNKQTLVAAPDAVLRTLVEAGGQSQSGPLLDRVREAPAGSDLYLAVDLASIRPLLQMGMPPEMRAQAGEQAKPLFDALELIAGIDLTVNVATPGPTSLILHANDEAAAQQLESMVQMLIQQARAQQAIAIGDDPISQAMVQYQERMSSPFTPERNGTSLRCFHLDGQNPAQQQLVAIAIVGIGVSLLLPAVQAARAAAQQAAANEAGSEPAQGEF